MPAVGQQNIQPASGHSLPPTSEHLRTRYKGYSVRYIVRERGNQSITASTI